MEVLVINGSPKKEKSNTFQLTQAFLAGMVQQQAHNITVVHTMAQQIQPCLGCFACWNKTPGSCVREDDMQQYLPLLIKADVVVWSFPLYYYGVPSTVKAFMDRMLPLNLPDMVVGTGETSGHPPRYDLSHQRHVLISTCGFFSKNKNYDALLSQFDILFGRRLTSILCPEGELFRVPQLRARTSQYLEFVQKAGAEYAAGGVVAPATKAQLDQLLYPPEVFVKMANASWGVKTDAEQKNGGDEGEKNTEAAEESLLFMRQMAAIYNSGSAQNLVLEICFTDMDKTYQLVLGEGDAQLKTDDFAPCTTRIETPFDVLQKVSSGEISGSQAMMDGLYKTQGDFKTMLNMGKYFGMGQSDEPQPAVPKKPHKMLLLLAPFLCLWVFITINPVLAGSLAVLMTALTALMYRWFSPTPYEKAGNLLCAAIGITAMLRPDIIWLPALPSFAFGTLWLVSVFQKIPLCAYYSSSSYGGEKAFENPLFMRTNRIIAVPWGISNLLLGLCTFFVVGTPFAPYWGLISNLPTIILGVFTVWFVGWYPAKVARG